MKVQDFAYQVAIRTIELLEETQHYKIPENLRKEIGQKILNEVDKLLKKWSGTRAPRERSGAPRSARPPAPGFLSAGKPGTSPRRSSPFFMALTRRNSL